MFGGGFYLAEDFSKSNQYIECPMCHQNAMFCNKSGICTHEGGGEGDQIEYGPSSTTTDLAIILGSLKVPHNLE